MLEQVCSFLTVMQIVDHRNPYLELFGCGSVSYCGCGTVNLEAKQLSDRADAGQAVLGDLTIRN
jgi:hypothetical protein